MQCVSVRLDNVMIDTILHSFTNNAERCTRPAHVSLLQRTQQFLFGWIITDINMCDSIVWYITNNHYVKKVTKELENIPKITESNHLFRTVFKET